MNDYNLKERVCVPNKKYDIFSVKLKDSTIYIAIDGKNRKDFEKKFLHHQYSSDMEITKDVFLRQCNFDVDKRGGIRLILIKDGIWLSEIVKNNIEYELLEINCEEFIPFIAYKHKNKLLKMGGVSYNFLDLDISTSYSFSTEWLKIFNNEYLKYKNKYVICDGVVQKVRFSHFEVTDEYVSDEIKKLVKEGNYEKITEFNFGDDNRYFYDMNCIYEIVEE